MIIRNAASSLNFFGLLATRPMTGDRSNLNPNFNHLRFCLCLFTDRKADIPKN